MTKEMLEVLESDGEDLASWLLDIILYHNQFGT